MSLRHTLLAILDWVPLHGYALRETAKTLSWLHPMTNANIYPTLRQLEADGFIKHRQEIVEGRLRKVYETTADGRNELGRWLGDATGTSGVYRDPKLLKIALLRPGSLESARAWIEREIAAAEAAISFTEKFMDARQERIPRYTMLVGRHGVDMVRLRVGFLKSVLAEIDADLAAPRAD